MNSLALSAFSAIACMALGAQSLEAKVIGHFKADGAFADLAIDSDPSEYATLGVYRGGTPQSPVTYLNYFVLDCNEDKTICSGVSAFGAIPNGDFTQSNRHASLLTNTSANPNFSSYSWITNSITGEVSQTPINLGTFDLKWLASDVSSYKSIGVTSESHLDFTWKSTGQATGSSAVATGTVAGEALSSTNASLGSNSNNEISMERK